MDINNLIGIALSVIITIIAAITLACLALPPIVSMVVDTINEILEEFRRIGK